MPQRDIGLILMRQLASGLAVPLLLVDNTGDLPDWPTGPICGDCYQAREMDNELWWSEDEP